MTAVEGAPNGARASRDTPVGLRIAIICAMMGTFMQVLDSTIANVALPYMQGTLQASRDQITWVLTSYIVAAAVMTAPVGWLAARIGRKPYFLISMAGFTVTSAMCGAAQSLDQMIVFRMLQGLFGAALSPLSQAVVLDRFPPEKRGMIMSIWGMVVMVGPIMGPTLGGWLTDNYSWRWVFYVNVPVGILAVLGMFIFLSEDETVEKKTFDWTGFTFFAVAIAALQFMLDRGTSKDWFSSGEIITEAILSGTGAYLFIVHYFTSDQIFLPRGLLKDVNFVSALVLTFFVGVLMLAPRGVGTMLTMMLMGKVVMKVDARLPMAVGCVLLTWSMWQMSSWTPSVTPTVLASTTFVQGVGMGLIFIPANVMAFATLPSELRTDAAAIINLVRNMGMALGVSITSSALAASMQTVHASLAAHVTPFNRALSVNAPALFYNPQLPLGRTIMEMIVNQQALAISYADTFYLMLFLSLPAFLVLLVIPKPEPTLGTVKIEPLE
ncbi:MAG: DHA2 family efflux MFS transporter permease subunit [Rhizomicrobium sp.]